MVFMLDAFFLASSDSSFHDCGTPRGEFCVFLLPAPSNSRACFASKASTFRRASVVCCSWDMLFFASALTASFSASDASFSALSASFCASSASFSALSASFCAWAASLSVLSVSICALRSSIAADAVTRDATFADSSDSSAVDATPKASLSFLMSSSCSSTFAVSSAFFMRRSLSSMRLLVSAPVSTLDSMSRRTVISSALASALAVSASAIDLYLIILEWSSPLKKSMPGPKHPRLGLPIESLIPFVATAVIGRASADLVGSRRRSLPSNW